VQNSSIRAAALRKKYNSLLTVFWFVLLAVGIVAPFIINSYLVGVLCIIYLYMMLSISLNISSGFCGVTTFATGALYGMGAYMSAFMLTKYGVPFFPSLLVGTISAGVIGLIISGSAYKVSGTYLTLVSYGMLQVFNRIVVNYYEYTGGSSGFHVERWKIFGMALSKTHKYYFLLAVVVIFFLLQKNLYKSQWGRDFLAIKNNPIAASGLGINVGKTRIIGFMISSLMAGCAGALYGSYASFISPESFTFQISIMILLMIIVGGRGTLTGPIIGTLIIYIVPEIFNEWPNVKQIVYGALLIVFVQLLPQGLCGVVKRRFPEVAYNKEIEGKPVAEHMNLDAYQVNAEDPNEDILVAKGLTKKYGGLVALNNLDMTIKRGTIHALIGPNGAGKTTCVNNMTGIEAPTSGTVTYKGKDITGINSSKLAYLGVTRTYQHVRLFEDMSVIDNVVTGARLSRFYGLGHALFSTKKRKKTDKESYLEAQECLENLGLGTKSNEFPGNMSAGQQKLLEIARAFVAKPELLILDEPCAGLTETETAEFATLMKEIRKTGISILLIEHHMSLVMDVSDYITVIDHGTKIGEGTPAVVSADPVVRKAYLGE